MPRKSYRHGVKRRARVWSFSLGDPSSVAQQVRIVGPLSRLPADRFDYVYAPSWRALGRLAAPPDVAVFHRNFYPFRETRKVVAALRRRGGKSVIDIDDLITEVPEGHPSYAHYRDPREAEEIIRSVDTVTVTNARLRAAYERLNPNVHVLPNTVLDEIWGPPAAPERPASDKCVVVYSGAPQHARDLDFVLPALRHILQKYCGRVELRFIGWLPESLRDLPGVHGAGLIYDYAAYARLLRRSGIDLAVAALKDEPFNACKSDIKFIEFSACAIPGVYSDVGPYRDSVENGETGVLVPNATDAWISALERLVEDPVLRAELGRKAMERVWARCSLSANEERWREVYARLAPEGRGGLSAAALGSYGPYLLYALLKGRASA